MAIGRQKTAFERIGCAVSAWVADVAAHPFAQIGIMLFCALWWTIGLPTDILTAGLSILAITLTQMVLNNQRERESDDHRRDVAMHAKLDELLISHRTARNEMVGIEELDEEDIENLKQEAAGSIDDAGPAAGDEQERAAAKRAVVHAVEDVTKARRTRRRVARQG